MFTDIPKPKIEFYDMGERLSVSWEELYKYCGPSQIIATALSYRLFEQAFRELDPGACPDRRSLSFLTAFPGRGVLECLEYITRIPSLAPENLVLDLEAGPVEAPPSKPGRFYFELQAGEQRRAYYPRKGFFDETFLNQVASWQDYTPGEEGYEAYRGYKREKARSILAEEEEFFVSSSLPPRRPEKATAPRFYGIDAYREL